MTAATLSPVAEAQAIATMTREPDSISLRANYNSHPTVKIVWVLAQLGETGEVGTVTETATLTVSHWSAPHKAYVALLNRTTVTVSEHGTGELSSPMDAVKVATQPAARYSRKAQLAFAQFVHEQVVSGTFPQLARYFSPFVSFTA